MSDEKDKDEKDKQEDFNPTYIGIGLALGSGLGTTFGVVFDNTLPSSGRASRGDERHELGPGAGEVRVRGVLLRAGVERASLANRALHGELVRVS